MMLKMKNFNEIYEEIYREYQEPIEQMRKAVKNRNLIVLALSVLLGLILTLITKQIAIIIIFIGISFIYVLSSKNARKYKNFFKENVIKKFVKEYCDTLEYIPETGVPSYEYSEAEFENFDNYYTEDLITGLLDNKYKILMAEVHTEDKSTDSHGNTTYTTLFRGLFAKIELEKLINANIKIRRNQLSLFGKKEKLEMDSGEFEKNFDIYSTDKIIAMQLLTADIMQMLLDFKEQNKITPEMTLKNNTLYIRFATGKMFEANILKKSLDYETLQKYYNTIDFTLSITEKFLKNIEETEL